MREDISFEKCNFQDAVMRNENKNWVDFYDCRFRYADLTNWNFNERHLENCDLEDAVLRGCSFKFTDMFKSNLKNADVFNANFDYANLVLADLSGIDTSSINLSKAYL